MGTARGQRRPRSMPRAATARRLAAPALLSGVLLVGLVPSASADKTDHAFPSQDEVVAAEQRVAETARDVGAIKASLLMANQRLEAAAVAAEMASEKYNGAMWRLGLAREELAGARREAAAARRRVAEQRRSIGALVASSYQHGGELTALNAMMGADGPEGVLDQYVTFQGVSETLQADYDRFAATEALAEAYEEHAATVRAKAERLAAEAREAKDQAAQAAAGAQQVAQEIAEEKDRLIRELADAQDISVSLARQRQTALEEIARERAAARARAEAEETARQQALQEARDRAEARREARTQAVADRKAAADREAEATAQARAAADRQAREEREREAREPREADQQTPLNTPQPASPPPAPAPPPPPPPPSGSGGADRAIAFATAQVGEPYVWGAAGPDSWDCSGLMLEAWGQSGVYLPHYSVAQYYAGTPISSSDLRPGDLVFWGTSSSPDSIHHVAMYIGNGQIVHAPRTGRPVSVDSMYYWTPPNFFARV
ncbi:MAG TPA: C40 family peptidase [Nocardioidaceae bacterium]|nr:C40 family peptidase [Nocardioidaceae bacterium]